MGFALLFSGQGMQHPGMLPWLVPGETLQQTIEALAAPDWRQRLADPAWSANNHNAQLLLTGTALAAWEQLAPELPPPLAVAGYSVGELAAFSAAGVLAPAQALALAHERARAMDAAAAALAGGLSGVTGLALPQVQALCDAAGVAIAIHNGPDSVVLGGPLPALAQAEQLAEAQGARCTRLKVAVASHTRWMQPARAALAQVLAPLPLAPPRAALFCNATGQRMYSADDARTALATQLDQTVCWSTCMDNLYARRVDCVLEIGPGQSLARLWNQRYPEVPARSGDEFHSAGAVVRWVRGHLEHRSGNP